MTRIWLTDGFVDLERQEVTRGGTRQRLTPTEHRLLTWLAERPGILVTQERLLSEVWGYSGQVRSRTVYTTIQRLRKKLEPDPAEAVHLVSVYGAGYRLDPAPPPVSITTAPEPERSTAHHTLPTETTSFCGREDVLLTVAAALEEWPVVTLRGTGGIGKTRLALRFAHAQGRATT